MTKYVLLLAVFLVGCGNLSPRQEQRLNNQNGKIGELENMQNSMKAEVGKLQSQAEIQNSKLDRLQQGLLNLQQNSDNHGVMIFSGTGGVAVACILGFVFLTALVIHYRSQAKVSAQTADILAERIVMLDDPAVENAVFETAIHSAAAENVLGLIKRHKDLYLSAKPTDRQTS